MERGLEEAFTISVSPLQWLLTRVVGRVREHPWKLLEQREMGLLSNSLHTLVCTTANWDFLEIQPYFSNPACNLLNFPSVQRKSTKEELALAPV